MTVVERLRMPSLDGATGWLNSEPLGPAELRGRIVLVDFWTLTCINWLRTEPYIRAWSQAYRADGLVVIGVHTPEFSFEHELDLVRQAIKEMGIDYPVAADNDYAVWNAFDNNYWPALYFADAEGETPGASHGVDVDEQGNGLRREGHLYQLVRQHDGVGERTLEIEFLEPGAEAYAFTFG